MDDLISRQAAIDALYHHFSRMSREECAMILHEVPSAELANKSPKLDSKKGELISRQEALKCFAEYSDAWCAIHSLPWMSREECAELLKLEMDEEELREARPLRRSMVMRSGCYL